MTLGNVFQDNTEDAGQYFKVWIREFTHYLSFFAILALNLQILVFTHWNIVLRPPFYVGMYFLMSDEVTTPNLQFSNQNGYCECGGSQRYHYGGEFKEMEKKSKKWKIAFCKKHFFILACRQLRCAILEISSWAVSNWNWSLYLY